MRFKNWFIVSKNGLVGHVTWYGHYSVCIEFYCKGRLYWSGEVFKDTLVNNLRLGIYKVIKGVRW